MLNLKIAERIANMPTSIFSTMSRMAYEYEAVNLGQGFPDFDGPEWIVHEAFKAMKDGKNQYAPLNGIFSLRKAVQSIHKKYYDLEWDANTEITVTAGATEALFSTIHAFVNKGDEAILFEPFYDSYQADVILAGAIPKYVTLKKPDFHFDREELEAEINSKTKMIILNTPHNPTGKIFNVDELNFIAGLVIKHNLLLVCDEVYEFLTFDNLEHIPIVTLPGMRERTITISSTGKTFGMTGWKIGFAAAEKKLTEAIQKVHQWTTYSVNTPGQHAMAYALTRLDSYLPEFRDIYTRKRDMLYSELKDTAFKPHKTYGSYFIMADIPEKYRNDIEAASELVKKHGVATIPTSVFYSKSDEGKSMLRLCFAKKEETLKEGIKRLKDSLC